jgi:DNA-directed RNA polymerase specialized sigma24 family protein
MTAKEYLGQAYRLDQRINADLEEVARLREMANSISSPSWEEKPGGTRPTEPHWARCIYKIIDLERHIDEEVDKLVDLKAQIRTVIDALPNKDEQTVLRYRCLLNYTFEKIGDLMCADKSTAWYWYNRALKHVVLPENPIEI